MAADFSPLMFVLGPSGIGKSSFGRFLSDNLSWLHFEIDQVSGDGIDKYQLRSAWDEFWEGISAKSLAAELVNRIQRASAPGLVLTFPGNVVLTLEHHRAAEESGIQVIYLYGSAGRCIERYMKRESSTGRNLGLDHWQACNHQSYLQMSHPDLADYRIELFDFNGMQTEWESVYRRARAGGR